MKNAKGTKNETPLFERRRTNDAIDGVVLGHKFTELKS